MAYICNDVYIRRLLRLEVSLLIETLITCCPARSKFYI